MNFILFGQGGYYNRGCEAIVRSTTLMLRRAFPDCKVYTAAYDYKGDRKANYGVVDKVYPHSNVRYTLPHIMAFVNRKLGNAEKDIKWQYKWLEGLLDIGDVFISIGGDNYCYEEPLPFYHIDKMIKDAGKKLIFWGASFDKELITDAMKEDLERFDAIVVRESLSYKALRDIGLERVFLNPDPAFTMGVEQCKLPDKWIKGNTIGVNLSPLSMRYSKDNDKMDKAINKLIDYIIDATDSAIALIPHVEDSSQGNTQHDIAVLKPLLEKYENTGRIFLINHSEYNAKQIKGFISRTRMFIGARTHSTIAAYSTGVPTLAIGYSIKAKGIAQDIYDKTEGHLISIDMVDNEYALVDIVSEILLNEKENRLYLSKYMHRYKQASLAAIKHIEDVVNE